MIDSWPLKVSLPSNTCIGGCVSGTLGQTEEGTPTSNTPAETLNFITSALSNALVHSDFSAAAFSEAVKSSSESYSVWETALSCLKDCGPWQVPEPSEEWLVIPAQNPSNSATVLRQHACIFHAASACSRLCYSFQKAGKPSERRAGDALFMRSS